MVPYTAMNKQCSMHLNCAGQDEKKRLSATCNALKPHYLPTAAHAHERPCVSTLQQVASTRVQSHENSWSLSAAPIATVRPLSDVPT